MIGSLPAETIFKGEKNVFELDGQFLWTPEGTNQLFPISLQTSVCIRGKPRIKEPAYISES